MNTRHLMFTALAACLLVSACGEKPQSATRKSDVAAATGAASAFTAPGWIKGDAGSWEQQMKSRAQGQNEYSRTGAP